MPSFQDSALLVFLALILFGPKKLPELARQLGKLMAEFRRASNEFRMQMEDELRAADQLEQQKKIEAMQAAAPIAPVVSDFPAITGGSENTIARPVSEEPTEAIYNSESPEPPVIEPLPIATSGDLNLMPPSTGLPISNATLAPVLDAIPHTPDPETVTAEVTTSEASHHG
jgi:sec-independent protein translocase protein TatB